MPVSTTGSVAVSLLLVCGATRAIVAQAAIGQWTTGGPSDWFGGAFASISDIDGDGVPDMLVGAEYADSSAGATGRVYAFSGATLGLIYTLDGSNTGSLFGYLVRSISDVDSDGVEDILVAAPQFDGAAGSSAGRVSVYSGGNGAWIRDHDGEFSGNLFGFSVAPSGDLDGDGVADYVVGARNYTSTTHVVTGKVYAYSGVSGAALFTLTGSRDYQQFGRSLVSFGDVDGDGTSEFAVGSSDSASGGGSGRGRIDVFSGATRAVIASLVGSPPDDAGLGTCLAACGDLDGDGVADLVVGDPYHLTNGPDSGAAFVYSGASWGPLYTWYGRDVSDQFGVDVACVGDANTDGVTDFIIGTSNGVKQRGSAFLYSGRTGNRLYRFVSDSAATLFGQSVCGVGDITGDGLSDILIGAVKDSAAGFEVGRVFAYSGNDLFLVGNGSQFSAGDTMKFDWNCPASTTLSALVVVNVSLTPCFIIVDIGGTDASGRRTFAAMVPNGLSGVDVSLQAFAIDSRLGVIDSAVEEVSIQ